MAMYHSKSFLTFCQLNTITKQLVIKRLISQNRREATGHNAGKKTPYKAYQHNDTISSPLPTCLYAIKPVNYLSRPQLPQGSISHLSEKKTDEIMVLPTNLSCRSLDTIGFLTDEKHIKFTGLYIQSQNPNATTLRGNHPARVQLNKSHHHDSALSFSGKKAVDHEPADDPKEKIRLLHEQLKIQVPRYFSKGNNWHDFSVYTPHVDLVITPKKYKKQIIYRGLNPYRRIAKAFRYGNKVCIKNPSLDLLSSICHEEKKTIEVRWRVCGVPYYLHIVSWLFPAPRSTFIRYYDYMSVLFVNDEGKIWRHDIRKVRQVPRSLAGYLNNLRRNLSAAAAVTSFVRKPASSNT